MKWAMARYKHAHQEVMHEEYEFSAARDAANKKEDKEKKKEDEADPSTVKVEHEDYDLIIMLIGTSYLPRIPDSD
jgi:hypothetical protein